MGGSRKLRIQKNELRYIGVIGFQFYWIRLVSGWVAAAVPKVKRSPEVLILGVVQVRQEPGKEN